MDVRADPVDGLGFGNAILRAQPFSVLIGARLTQFGSGSAAIEVPFDEKLQQQNGYLHGGVLAYAIDNAVSFAAGSVLGDDILTSGITVSYHRPARGSIVAEAIVITATRSTAAVRCVVSAVDDSTGENVIVASGHGTVALARRTDPGAGASH